MFYLGPYIWKTLTDDISFDRWAAPTGASSVIDLRPTPEGRVRGGVPQGFIFFKGPPTLPSEYLPLGDTLDTQLRTVQRNEWRRRLNFMSPMEGRTVADMVWETLTWRADPTGQSNAKPIIPTTRRQLELHIDKRIRRVRFTPNMREFNGIRAVLHNDYRKIREEVLDFDRMSAYMRRLLSRWL